MLVNTETCRNVALIDKASFLKGPKRKEYPRCIKNREDSKSNKTNETESESVVEHRDNNVESLKTGYHSSPY